MAWILAKKLEMTRVVKGDKFIPVTLLEVPIMKIVDIKTIERDWYEAIVVGVTKKTDLSVKEGNTALSTNSFSMIKEFPISEWELEKYKIWDDIGIDSLESVELVTVSWTSKWRWFAWAMKRHNFHGWPGWHGSKFHRALWSIGNRKPTRTHKGKKMHWHYGDVKVSIKKVPVELVNKEISVIGVRGWVPGWRNSIVSIIF